MSATGDSARERDDPPSGEEEIENSITEEEEMESGLLTVETVDQGLYVAHARGQLRIEDYERLRDLPNPAAALGPLRRLGIVVRLRPAS